MSEEKQQPHPLATLGGLIGAAGGFLLSRYCGIVAWVPGIILAVFLLIFFKTPLGPKRFAGAIATTAAHVAWFIFASLYLGSWSATIIDIIVLSVGILWLWAFPGLLSVLFLAVVQIASLVYNAFILTQMPFETVQHKALVVHCSLRVIAIVCLIAGYIRMRRERVTPPPIPTLVNQ